MLTKEQFREIYDMTLEQAKAAIVELALKIKTTKSNKKEDEMIAQAKSDLKILNDVYNEKLKEYTDYMNELLLKLEKEKL